MSKAIFITATGTDVGKTYITALLVKKLREAGLDAGYYKAALSGAEETTDGLLPGDAAYVASVAALEEKPQDMVSYIYKEAVSPHLAAARCHKQVELDVVKADYQRALARYDYLTVEGSGGIICPIRWDEQHILLEDIIKMLELGTLVVSGAGLGSINACVLTISYLRQKNIAVRGIILNGYEANDFMQTDNKRMIEEITGVSVIACVKQGDMDLQIEAETLAALYR